MCEEIEGLEKRLIWSFSFGFCLLQMPCTTRRYTCAQCGKRINELIHLLPLGPLLITTYNIPLINSPCYKASYIYINIYVVIGRHEWYRNYLYWIKHFLKLGDKIEKLASKHSHSNWNLYLLNGFFFFPQKRTSCSCWGFESPTRTGPYLYMYRVPILNFITFFFFVFPIGIN